jgi:ferredoxin
MDDKTFKQRLSEVAEWEIPNVTDSGNPVVKKRGRKSQEDLYQEEHEQVFLEIYDGKNPSVPPRLTKVKVAARTCEHCGKLCPSGCHTEYKQYTANNKTHWRTKCVTCGLWQNPYTGEFDLTTAEASTVWNCWCRDVKRRYNPKTPGPIEQPKIETTEVVQVQITESVEIYEVIETETNIIKRLVEKQD